MFSASLPPMILAAVLACMDVIEREPELLAQLRANIHYAVKELRGIGFNLEPRSAIIPLRVPVGMSIRAMSRNFHEKGIFINSIEFPAVPVNQQRFRVSVMATHTREDIHRLVEAVKEVWKEAEARGLMTVPA
jgi:glycine C-acetyltransferase